MLIIISGLILRVFLSFYVNYESLPEAGNDALAFHLEALNYLELTYNKLSEDFINYEYRIDGFTQFFSIYL